MWCTDPPVLSERGEVRRENQELNVDMAEPGSPQAYPFPSQVSWTKDGVEVEGASPTRVFNYSSIFIGSVEPSDSGVYLLSATNYLLNGSLLRTDSASLTLNVLCEWASSTSTIHVSLRVVRCGELLTFNGPFDLNLVVTVPLQTTATFT